MNDSGCEPSLAEPEDISRRIETLESDFDDLRTGIIDELSSKRVITVKKLIDTLTSLPLSLRKEYESAIRKYLHDMLNAKRVDDLFIHLNPLLSFIDYGLIELFIKKFGSDELKKDMRSYCSKIRLFMKETTIKQLIDHLPGQPEIPPKYSLLEAKIGQDAGKCTLEQIDTIRRRYCIEVQLSEIIFHLIAVVESNSFIVKWLVPVNFISNIVKFTNAMKANLFEECKLMSLTLDGMWLYKSEAEIEAIWLHTNDSAFACHIHGIYEQIVRQLKIGNISKKELSQYLMDQQPNLPKEVSIVLSEAFIKHHLSASIVDFEMLNIIVEQFGNDCLKTMMKSYCTCISLFTKHLTAQQLINLQHVGDNRHQEIKHEIMEESEIPPNSMISLMEAKIAEDASKCTWEQLDAIRRKICIEVELSEMVLHLATVAGSNPLTIRWLVPSVLITKMNESTLASMKVDFFEENNIASLTLDELWLYLSEAEIDAMWAHVSECEINSCFHIMHEQTVHQLRIGKVSVEDLSQCLTHQQPNLQMKSSISLSEAFINRQFSPSFIDFMMLNIIGEQYGNNCLKNVLKSCYSFMSDFAEHSTAQRLIHLQLVYSEHPQYCLKANFRIEKEPSDYTIDNITNLKDTICAEIDLNKFALALHSIRRPVNGSFLISSLVPQSLAFDLINAVNRKSNAFYTKNRIVSLAVGDQWVYNPKLYHFSAEVRKRYQKSLSSLSPIEWIPSPTRKIFRLAMIQRERVQQGHVEDRFVQMTITGRIDDILFTKSPIQLENIIRDADTNEIILIEGAPGSGKSTLAVHICQRWSKGELFQQFTVVILVQLRDPAVQRAKTIADLLPIDNAAIASELGDDLVATNGHGVLWVLDGWDELPLHLQQHSIFYDLLLRMLDKCSVIVTSRPISSGNLHSIVSSRIEVLGFTQKEQRQYFTECLKGDTKALEALLEKIQANPVVQSICYLPLNAAFVVHTFKYRGQSLPNTEYEIYLSVILSCIQRHFEKEGRGLDLSRELVSLYDLFRSETVREPFQRLCELAYHGVMENKVTFSSSDLPQGSNTLSLLQAIASFLQKEKSVFYNFLHLSVQEILSAYYIATWLPEDKQISQFQQLFNQPRFAAVFQFYAAITKLKCPGIRQVIARIVEAKSKPLLLHLLHCLYEAQDPSICLYVVERLECQLDLRATSLSLLDCLCIGYFLSSVAGKEIHVNFYQCRIGDLGAKYLTKCLLVSCDIVPISKLTVDLSDNAIHEKGASHIARSLSSFEHLHLFHNPVGDTGISLMSEAIRETAILKTLILYGCGVTSRGAEDLSRALAENTSLEKLDVGNNSLGDEGIKYMAEALKLNKQLKELWISDCGMTDKGAAALASALSVNNSLKMLDVGGLLKGHLTEEGLSTIARSLVNKSEFTKLVISSQFTSAAVYHLRWEVNEIRKWNGLQPIEIEGQYQYVIS